MKLSAYAFSLSILASTGLGQVTATVTVTGQSQGNLETFVSTSFSIDSGSFIANSTNAAALAGLGPQHLRVFVDAYTAPLQSDNSWNFAALDAVLPQLLSIDPDLILDPGEVPAPDLPNGNIDSAGYAAYVAGVIQYYNQGAFTDPKNVTHFRPTGAVPLLPIRWLSLYDEPNTATCGDNQGAVNMTNTGDCSNITMNDSVSECNVRSGSIFDQPNSRGGLTYAHLYNCVASHVEAVDSNIRIVAGELSFFYPNYTYASDIVGAITQRVDAFSFHQYPIGCGNFNDPTQNSDLDVMNLIATTPGGPPFSFVSLLEGTGGRPGIAAMLQANPMLQNAQVWMTETNVASLYSVSGVSSCNSAIPYSGDPRAPTGFFAAWEPYLFSQMAQVKTPALPNGLPGFHHWDYHDSLQFGDVDNSGNLFPAYWVDRYLSTLMTAPSAGPVIIGASSSNTASIESFAIRRNDGSVVVMVVNHATTPLSGGAGMPAAVTLNVSALTSFNTVTQVLIDSSGHATSTLAPASTFVVTFRNGYGVAFLKLTNAAPAAAPGVASVVSSATSASGPLTAGSIATIYGSNLASSPLTANGQVPTTLAGTQVLVNGIAAPLFYVSPSQINFQVPWETVQPNATVTVSITASKQTLTSAGFTVPVAPANPGLYTFYGTNQGVVSIAQSNPTAIAAPALAYPNSRPAKPGDYLVIYCTGLGAVAQTPLDGALQPNSPLNPTTAPVTVFLGGVPVPASFGGLTPSFAGLYQVNVQVPSQVMSGAAVPLSLTTMTGASSNIVTVAIASQ